jgi:hypothetical protein
MKRAIIIIAALASTSLVALSQTKDAGGTTIGNVEKTVRIRQSVSYPTMLDMTFPEFEAAAAKTDIALLPIGAVGLHQTKNSCVASPGRLFGSFALSDLSADGCRT